MRKKIPFGIGQIGKSFRNEITPGNFIFRTREFEQMELEFFCKPGTDKEWFDYKEFRDPEKVYNSIVNGTPLLRQLRLVDQHARAGYHLAFLTARGLQDVVDKALRAFLKYRDANGNLVPVDKKLKSDISAAVNDIKWIEAYPGAGDPEKKAMVIKSICQKYAKVKFVDDDRKNIEAARALKIPNLQVIEANKKPLSR